MGAADTAADTGNLLRQQERPVRQPDGAAHQPAREDRQSTVQQVCRTPAFVLLKPTKCTVGDELIFYRDFDCDGSLDESIENMERGSLASFGSGGTTDSEHGAQRGLEQRPVSGACNSPGPGQGPHPGHGHDACDSSVSGVRILRKLLAETLSLSP